MILLMREQRHFIFDATVTYLENGSLDESDPLTLLALLELFQNLRKDKFIRNIQEKIDQLLDNLAEISESGFQLRDCLVVSKYALQLDLMEVNSQRFQTFVLPRIEYASSLNWFNEPELASVIAALSDRLPVSNIARLYLKSNLEHWIHSGYTEGVIHAYRYTDQKAKVLGFLEQVQWRKQTLTSLSWVLTVLGGLDRNNPQSIWIRSEVAEIIYDKYLYENDSVHHMLRAVATSTNANEPKGSYSMESLTSYELALATYALSSQRYQMVIGVHPSQRDAMEQAITLLQKMKKGGVYVSRRQLWMYDAAVFGFLLLLLNIFIGWTGLSLRQAIGGALLEWLIPALIASLVLLFLLRAHPAQTVSEVLFGRQEKSDGSTTPEI